MSRPLCAAGLVMALTATGCATLPIALEEARDNLVPIEVALEPDPALDNRANTGKSHIALARHFIRGSDLHHVSSAIAQVMATTKLDTLNLTATGYQTANWNGLTGTAMAIYPSQELRRLEERIVDAIKMFVVDPETAEDFIDTSDGAAMRGNAIDHVRRFVPEYSGVNFRPHAMVNPAQSDAVKKLESQPFQQFTFKVTTATVYQLDQQGIARRPLWTWTGEIGAR